MNVTDINRSRKLFSDLKWPLEDMDGDTESRFDRFCSMVSLLTEPERELIFALTEDFLDCSLSYYKYMLNRIFNAFDFSILSRFSEIIAVPILTKKDFGKVKSGSLVLYLFRNMMSASLKTKRLNYFVYDRPDLIKIKHSRRKDALVIYLDDFIGSGKTVSDALLEYSDYYKVESDSLLILSLVAQQEAIDKLESMGYKYKIGQIRARGISDSARISDTVNAFRIMDNIEKRLGVSRQYKYGFMQSEALVSLARCPNNTFPVYWKSTQAKGAKWPAPFQR